VLNTKHARGTSCYRAPELVHDFGEGHEFNYTNTVDIWAVGCILYELVLRKKAFLWDIDVQQYSKNPDPRQLLSPLESEKLPQRSLEDIQKTLRETLEVESARRPSATELLKRFQLFQIERLSISRETESHDDVDASGYAAQGICHFFRAEKMCR
jgi:serine/threonine protein kinase